MSDYRRHKKTNYTCIDNQVFRDHSLSMKAKGLLAQIYSLPDDWEYSVKGLSTLFSDGREAVNNALMELIEHGYIIRTQRTNQYGKFDGYEYDIYETPQVKGAENPFTENPLTGKPITENPTQLNTNIENTKESKTKEMDIYIEDKPKKQRFVPPTLEEVRAYCEERNNHVDPEKFISYYLSNGWRVGKNPMKDWKAAVRTWERNNYSQKTEKTQSRMCGNEFTEILERMQREDESAGNGSSFGDFANSLFHN